MESGEFVLSDVHIQNQSITLAKDGFCLTCFRFKLPASSKDLQGKSLSDEKQTSQQSYSREVHSSEEEVHLDEDGDLVVPRKRRKTVNKKQSGGAVETADHHFILTIEHSLATQLEDVGRQVWSGSLLLADFIIHHQTLFTDRAVLDLGAGTGISSIVAAFYAKNVIATGSYSCVNCDFGGKVLHLLQHNMNENLDVGLSERQKNYDVKELCWMAESLDDNINKDKFGCSAEDIENIKGIDLILGADVIYDDNLTDALLRTVYQIMMQKPEKTFYLAFEKRYVFTIHDKDIMCPAFDHFKSCLDELHLCNEENGVEFRHEQVPIDFPQYFQYQRTKELMMWKIYTKYPNR